MRYKFATFRHIRVSSSFPIKILFLYFTDNSSPHRKEKERALKKARRDISSRSPRHSRDFHVRPRVGISRLHHREFLRRCAHIDTHGHIRMHTLVRALVRSLTRRLCPTSLLDKVVAGINWPCSPRCIPVDLLELQHET